MPKVQQWPLVELFENALDGVSSAITPELILPSQLAWGINTINRGAKPGTRPPIKFRCTLPNGLVQGASYFGVQGGMGVVSINGFLYRLRITSGNSSVESIPLPWPNSGVIKQVYMQQTVESLVVQDGQSDPIIYNGSIARRANQAIFEVPRGRQMAYGNGRLWVAVNGNELVAGDIRTGIAGSELFFTETNYLSGGGKLFFPRGLSGLAFIATTGTTDYGALLAFGSDYTVSIRADISFRDLWAQTPGFETNILRHTGCASHWSIVEVNQDLYWRDASGGIRSIRSALADENGPGNAPISREVSRLTDFDSPQLLPYCSGISFNNRLIMTSSPRLNDRGGITWRDLIALDFAPISTMRGKTLPAYDGQWQGINFTHLFQGQFQGKSRAFAISAEDNGSNALWEIMPDGEGSLDDTYEICTDGSGVEHSSPIECVIEHGRRTFGNSAVRKRLERCDVYLWDMQGEINLQVFWRCDNNQKWQRWNEEAVEICAKITDPETQAPHTWKNLLPQQRPQIKTFTIPSNFDDITRYSLATGFEFQIRLVWTGRTKIYKTVLFSSPLDDPAYALRDVLEAVCLDNDVTGNEIVYKVPSAPCTLDYSLRITLNPSPVTVVFIGLVDLSYRRKIGTPGLIGFDEFIPTSSPPKRYLQNFISENYVWCTYINHDCSDNPARFANSVAGAATYDPLTGVLAKTTYRSGVAGSSSGCSAPAISATNTVDRFVFDGNFMTQISTGRIQNTFGPQPPCHQFSPRDYVAATGGGSETLSVEDTESNAIARFEAANPQGSWGATQLNAYWERRTSGYTFGFGWAQFQLNLTGFSPGQAFNATVPIFRGTYPGGLMTLYQVIEINGNADGSGNFTYSADIPNASGFETRADSASVFLL